MFDIDPMTLIVSALLIVAFASPLIFQRFKNKNKLILQQATFSEFAEMNNARPTLHEQWRNHYHLGIDTESKKVVYHRFGSYPEQTVIDLNEVKKVSVQEKSRVVIVGKEKRFIIDYLALQFHFKDESHSPKTLETYDGDLYSDMAGERGLTERWKEKIENILKS
ncbi:hypothetical protein [Algoriphagus antarcticus]|uniref:Uncharacterized protein n=1 Tax=Algoriphagus antarcticus TaxID=238540 RepID=A0A3E0E8Z5_9BACT|nr:hypothetical protein [Algoriphagus antarcticus]REG94213.1 hypothetical protein C8N25_10138 [Algoriphagus antarcticus]